MTQGVVVSHGYTEPGALSWFSDTGFALNGVHIAVWWIHPRTEYQNQVDNLSVKLNPWPRDLDGKSSMNRFEKGENFYKLVGKSGKRKKLAGMASSFHLSPAYKEWFGRVEVERQKLMREGDVVVRPSMSVSTLSWCRGVSICIPTEIHGIEDLKSICTLVKGVLLGKTTLQKEYPNSTYTKEDWVKDEILTASLLRISQT